jgi:very-short-patch-repair endonuclease
VLFRSLKTFPEDYASNYFNKVNELQKIKTRNKTNNKYVCKNCGNLIFFDKYYRGCGRKICNYCKDQKTIPRKTQRNFWYEWEDNIIQQFYYGWTREKIKELLPHRSWSSIMHRAKRLQVKRKNDFMWKHNAWTSINNPIHNPISKEKMIKNKQKQIFKRNKMTSIEKKIADFLDSQKIKYNFNKVVRTKTSFKFPDFQVGNLIIECDGIYWHQMRSKEDEERQKELEELGFEVIRFTDDEINKNWEAIEQCIKQKLNL